MKILIGLAALLFTIIIGAGIASDGPTGRTAPPAAGVYDADTVARAGAMTQQMSVDGPLSGHEYHNHAGDEQLRLSSDPQFVREIEVYQAQIDRMLARNQ